ncbi:MAG: nucleotidyltransferase family protein [Clostridia bacterium]|nr:nucleotidyltransferase family protein [Clostridia bacterium]
MTVTQSYFVNLIKHGINGERINYVPQGLNYKELYKLCAFNSTSVIVYKAILGVSGELPQDFFKYLEKLALYHVKKDIQSEFDTQKVITALEENGLKYMPLKGYYLKKLYPSTDMRYTADCDVLIDVLQIKKLHEVASEIGLKPHHFDEHHDVFIFPETKTLFEFHKTLFVGKLENYFGIGNKGFEKATIKQGSACLYELSAELFYLSMLAHSAYHFSAGAGVGIRHLTDVYLYKKHYNLNEQYLNKELEKCGLLKFKNEFENLANYFFNDIEPSEFTLKLASHVLSSSLHSNEDLIDASSVANKLNDGGVKTAKKKAVLKRIFPPKESMQFSYPVLKKLPWLIPVFYVVRWFDVLVKRPKNVKKIRATSVVKENDVLYMQEINNGLGITHL